MNRKKTTSQIDPISLEIQWQRLIAIMDEIDNATVRTSFSTIVGESRDFACILVDQAGSSLCQSSLSPPNFCVVLPRTAKVLLETYPLETLQGQTGRLYGHGRSPGRRGWASRRY
jgi:N-methylhydantoinase B